MTNYSVTHTINAGDAIDATVAMDNWNGVATFLNNKNLDTGNLADSIVNGYLKLATVASHKLAFGGPYNDPGSWGGTPEHTTAIPHGVTGTPIWAMAIATPANSSASSTDPVVVSGPTAMDSTNITFKLRTLEGGNCNFPGVSIYWVAIF